ncbi:tetratricopeptide repeat-containing protein [Toxoplasma gondii GT1]|uniref:Tetratricopeptide repeat-containing protein n=4 Tax=Toxoplasma gondii TaxID=5811 RepID=S7UJU7_TOXGG|nr:tetratricopeptide repeat-containing protein [Toxoplasma gondii GT1]KAF4646036.1 tetratricopeptide repeat-containing protein [Toxoplasma gondii]KFG30720.1 tetratricopeptide repeat-containing protein [Toxoplasma gondii p89]KFH05805.1 tetratricopeptide repeat-containing protein [Toxoplasma gondii VAND]
MHEGIVLFCRLRAVRSVRVNIGNIYLAQGRHGEALKMYHIALDSTPANSNFLRCKLLKTIGDAYFLAGKFTEATATYEQLLKVRAQLGWSVSAFLPRGLRGPSRCVSVESESLNLLLCYYAAGNKAKMQEHFLHMLVMQDDMSGTDELVEDDEDDDEDQLSPSSMSPLIVAAQSASFFGASSCCPFPDNSPNHGAACSPPSSQNSSSSGADLSPASGEPDGFTQLICQRRKQTYRRLVLAGGLVAQALAGNVTGSFAANLQSAFDWVIECFRSHGYRELAYEIEMHKANALLRLKCGVDTAVKIYRSFEHVERHHAVLTPRAWTNLSFIYILENDLPQATKYADIALSADRYNAHALVNKGCCLLLAGKRQEARHLFLEALGLDTECVEALYNFGLACKIDDQLDEALEAFSRFNQILPSQPEVLYHLGDISESMGQYEKTMEWFSLLTSPGVRPTDARILGRMGAAAAAHSQDDEDKQALHYFLSSYSYYPYSLDVITWLGVYFVKQQLFDKAAEFFHRAAALQPAEPKWLLMVASCYRRSENFPLALALYKKVHREHPADVECLRCLVTVCKEMRIPDDQYAALLRKAENAQQIIYGLQPRGASSARLEERQPIVQSGRTTQIRSLGARQKTLALTDGAAPEEDMGIIENLVF